MEIIINGEDKRMYAIEDMNEMMNDDIFNQLLEKLKVEKSSLVKERLVMALENAIVEKKVGGGSIYAKVFALYLSQDAFLRSSAILILSAGNDNVARFLSANYDNSNPDIRKLIIDTLCEIATPRSVALIRKALNDENINVRITAVEHLGNLADAESIELFVQMLKTETRPMLIYSLLNAIVLSDNKEAIGKAIDIVVPNGDIEKVNRLYFSMILGLIGKYWEKEKILQVLQTNIIRSNYVNYSVEIVDLLTDAVGRFNHFIDEEVVLHTLVELLSAKNMSDKMPFIALNLLSQSKQSILHNKINEYYNLEDIDIQVFCTKIIETLKEMLTKALQQ